MALVSQEWWTLAMKSYKHVYRKDDPFIRSQIKFCNEIAPNEVSWKWLELFEWTTSNHIKVVGPGKSGWFARSKYVDGSILLPKEILAFQQLTKLTLDGLNIAVDTALELPTHLEHLSLNGIDFEKPLQLSVLISNLNSLKSLEINCVNLLLDRNRIQNLTNLSINLKPMLSYGLDLDFLLNSIRNSMTLQSISLSDGLIDSTWIGLIPKGSKKVQLEDMKLNSSCKSLFDPQTPNERSLLYFLCQDWSSLHSFVVRNLKTVFSTRHVYVCKPRKSIEYWSLFAPQSHVLQRITNKDGLIVERFSCIITNQTALASLENLPLTIKRLEINVQCGWIQNTILNMELASPHLLQELKVKSNWPFILISNYFQSLVNLQTLELPSITPLDLKVILDNCTKLENLTLCQCLPKLFQCLPNSSKHSSIKSITVFNDDDPIEAIINHFPCLKQLILHRHSLDKPTVDNLKILETLNCATVICSGNKELTTTIDGLNFKYALFQTEFGRSVRYLVGNSSEFFAEMKSALIKERNLVYIKGFSGQYLSSCGFQPTNNLHLFTNIYL